MSQLLVRAGELLWGPGSILFVLGTGVWFSVLCGFPQVTRIGEVWRETVGSLFARRDSSHRGGVTPFQAVSTALAGTMGTGNIAGIATALVAGGPGAIFWMWVSALAGMMTKYAEVSLAVKYRRREPDGSYSGGPMAYIEDGLGKRWLALIFSLCCVLASFGIGNATQVHSAAAALQGSFGISPRLTGLCFAAVTAMVIMGGIRRIGRVAEGAIPLVSLCYLAGGCIVLWHNRMAIPDALLQIVTCAVSPAAVGGGVGGYTVMTAMRVGVARGIFSNEAGLGSSPIAHASADAKSPSAQGYWGIFEVFVDTIVVCTFTALIILTSGGMWQSGLDGAALTAAAFGRVTGAVGEQVVAVSLACYALATLFCWGYYGERGVVALCGSRRLWVTLYRLAFVTVAVIAPTLELSLVWCGADMLNALMAIPNLFAILALSREVKKFTASRSCSKGY